jgi:hypothetical protein
MRPRPARQNQPIPIGRPKNRLLAAPKTTSYWIASLISSTSVIKIMQYKLRATKNGLRLTKFLVNNIHSYINLL